MDNEKFLAIPMGLIGIASIGVTIFWTLNYDIIYPKAGNVYWYIMFLSIAGAILSLLIVLGTYVKKERKNTIYRFSQNVGYIIAGVATVQAMWYFIKNDYSIAGETLGVSIFIFLVSRYGWNSYFKYQKAKEAKTKE